MPAIILSDKHHLLLPVIWVTLLAKGTQPTACTQGGVALGNGKR